MAQISPARMCFAPGAFQSKVPATLGCDDQAWPTLMGESGVASLARLETLCDACGKCDPATDIRRGTRRGNQPEPRPPNRTLWPPSGNASASYTGLTNTTVRNTWRGHWGHPRPRKPKPRSAWNEPGVFQESRSASSEQRTSFLLPRLLPNSRGPVPISEFQDRSIKPLGHRSDL